MCVQCIKHSHIRFIRMSRQCSFQPMAKNVSALILRSTKKSSIAWRKRIIHNTVHFHPFSNRFPSAHVTNQNKFRVQTFESVSDLRTKFSSISSITSKRYPSTCTSRTQYSSTFKRYSCTFSFPVFSFGMPANPKKHS